jgi:periplasmic copper chaperone A
MKHPLAGCALATILAAAPLFSSTIVAAADAATVSVGALKIENAFARPTPNGATVAAGYLTIINSGDSPDRLVSATSDISAKTQIHEMKMENGVMEMRELTEGLAIPAGATVALKPGGYHIMFVDLKHGVKPGDVIHTTLTFEKAGKVDVPFKAAASMGAMAPGGDMGGMKMAPGDMGGMKMK